MTGDTSSVRSISERTRLGVSLASFVAIAGGLLWAGFQLRDYTWRLEAMERRSMSLATREDLGALKREVMNIAREQNKGAVALCPGPRGQRIVCDVHFRGGQP